MLFLTSRFVVGGLLVPWCGAALSALEVAMLERQNNELMLRDTPHTLQKRVSTSFSLEQSLENEVLFDGFVNTSDTARNNTVRLT
jgi:hypothetical protein